MESKKNYGVAEGDEGIIENPNLPKACPLCDLIKRPGVIKCPNCGTIETLEEYIKRRKG